MVKVCLMGLPTEVDALLADLREHHNVLSVSSPYSCRNSEYVRVYVEVAAK